MKHTTFCVASAMLIAAFSEAWAQDLSQAPTARKPPPELRMQTILWDAEDLANDLLPQGRDNDLKQELTRRGMVLRDDNKIQVEIIGQEGGAPVGPQMLEPFGGEISNVWRHRVDAWVPVVRLSTLARALPTGYFMERADVPMLDWDFPYKPKWQPPDDFGPVLGSGWPEWLRVGGGEVGGTDGSVGGEGATAINSDGYTPGGSGRVIAVIDSGYISLTAARNNGDAPTVANTTQINYTPSAFESGTQHGTGCVEAVFDHAPAATYRLYKIDSLTDMGTAVNDAQANGVDVFSHSLSRYNTGWADNTGDACAAAADAANGGALFFTSAGNRAQDHWQGSFSDGDGDGWHQFSGGDETIDIVLQPNASASYYLAWNTAGGTSDYDLYLYASNLTTILASSTNNGNTFESFSYTNGGSTTTVHLSVKHDGGSTAQFELFTHDSGGTGSYEYQVAAGSTTSPSNSTNANVISNGAVVWQSFTSPNGTSGIIANYSSQGPTNGGSTKPDLTGPTNTTTVAYGGAFGGTSAATPNNAGAAAAFWSAHSGYNNSAIRWLLQSQADYWRDWGAAGNDNIYGVGGAILVDYVANTRWLVRNYGNTTNTSTGPYYTSQAAYEGVPSGGRVLEFPGSSYPEILNALGTKSAFWEVANTSATFGD